MTSHRSSIHAALRLPFAILFATLGVAGCASPTSDLDSDIWALSREYARLRAAVERGSTTAADFPPIFDASVWDMDPRVGNAIQGTELTFDGGRRQGILQLFVFNTLNLKAFLDQQEAQVQNDVFSVTSGVATRTRTAPRARFTQTARLVGGQVVYTGTIVFDGVTIVSFTQNLTTTSFDGEYRSPADRDTRHRMIAVPLQGGNRIEGSAYDLLNDGRANYTHLGLFGTAREPLRLLEFTQIDRAFDETSRDLARKVTAAVAAAGGEAAGGGGGAGAGGGGAVDAGVAGGGGAVDAGVAVGGGGGGGGVDVGAGQFPPLLDLRFFQLDMARVGSPGNSGAIFGIVNAVARNSTDDLQRFIDVTVPTFETDARGRRVEVRRTQLGGVSFESRQTFADGIQEAVIVVAGTKRLQFVRNHTTGAFRGIIIAPSFDRSAPIASIVTPNGDGTSNHLIIEDLANNLTNDYRGEIRVDSRALTPQRFVFFQQFNGGLAAQPESAALVRELGFVGVVRGF
ncbi:Hypothetical protein I5071_51940 [Sandaracinus amylolyticus]|nr:Hypothetical protein I5071_51940 [Sandaracinus amylolyticus]